MAEREVKKLTQVQTEILESLRDSGMLTVDRQNMAWLGDRVLQPATRYFLTNNGLITRLDKSRPVEAAGNGFVISKKGLLLLSQDGPNKKTNRDSAIKAEKLEGMVSLPTEKQLAFAKDLTIDVPSDATSEDVSDLISARTEKDKPANERHRSIAKLYGVRFTRFTGKRQLFERIFDAARRPTHEHDLAAWFTYRVYRHLVRGEENAPIHGPDHLIINEIAAELVADKRAFNSVRRYTARGLLSFGQWTAPDGMLCTGGSERTAAYEKAAALLKARLAFDE
jgi:hypothetical protein